MKPYVDKINQLNIYLNKKNINSIYNHNVDYIYVLQYLGSF